MNNDNIPDPAKLTEEIEGTIDNLFNPTRNIVIDPLTNEIKETDEIELLPSEEPPVVEEIILPEEEISIDENKEAAEPETAQDLSIQPEEDLNEEVKLETIDMDNSGPEEIKSDEQLSEANTYSLEVTPDNDKDNLSIDNEELDFELELEESDSNNMMEGQSNYNTQDNYCLLNKGDIDPSQFIEQLEQILLTVEWEIAPHLIEDAIKLVKQIKESDHVDNTSRTFQILMLIESSLEQLLVNPEHISTTAPSTLKKGIEALKLLMLNTTNISAKEQKIIETAINDLTELKRQSLVKPETKTKIQPEPKDKPKEKSKEKITENQPDTRTQKLLIESLKKQLESINECIDKMILPVEKALANNKDGQKLYQFHRCLRLQLESQYNQIAGTLKKLGKLPPGLKDHRETPDTSKSVHVQTIVKKATQSLEDQKAKPNKCPWDKLWKLDWNGQFCTIPGTIEISYSGLIPRRLKTQVRTGSSIELSRMKNWPWNKLKKILIGELAAKSEAELNSLTIPIIDNPAASKLFTDERNGSYLVILNTNQGYCALTTTTPPEKMSGPFDDIWIPEQGSHNPIRGYLKRGEQKIPVIDIEKLLISE